MHVQVSEVGSLYENLLIGLARVKQLTMSAACGCHRKAFTQRSVALALTDLYTADFFAKMLHSCSSTSSQDPACLRETYRSCGVSLMEVLPLVSWPNRL